MYTKIANRFIGFSILSRLKEKILFNLEKPNNKKTDLSWQKLGENQKLYGITAEMDKEGISSLKFLYH